MPPIGIRAFLLGKNGVYIEKYKLVIPQEIAPRVRAMLGTHKEIVATLSRQLSWSHFVDLLPLKTVEVKLFYAHEAIKQQLGVRDLRKLISRKAFERSGLDHARQ